MHGLHTPGFRLEAGAHFYDPGRSDFDHGKIGQGIDGRDIFPGLMVPDQFPAA